jgi:hypothetical protein
MGSIGWSELLVLALIVLLLVGVFMIIRGIVIGIVSRGLIACRACNRPMSPRAASCPHCGDPLTK